MDPLSLLSSIYDTATALKETYNQVKANKKQSATLNERVQLIIPHIHALEVQLKQKAKQGSNGATDSTLLGQLERLLHTLESCVKLVDKFTVANWLKRLSKKSDYTKQFADLNKELSLLSDDLQLGLSIKNVFDHSRDVADQQADLNELLAGKEEILSAAERIESSQNELHEHLLNGLSLDRQVLDGQREVHTHVLHGLSLDRQLLDGQHELHHHLLHGLSLDRQILDGQQHLQREQLNLQLTAEQQRKQAELELMSRRRFQNEIMLALKELQSPISPTTRSSTSTSSPTPSPRDLALMIDYSDLEFSSTEPVGSGGFGDVFFGRWISRDLDVAIKKLRVNSLTKTVLAEFNAEVELLASVPRHDHVVGLLGICVDPAKQIYLIVLDWMEQGSLFEFLRRSTFPNATPLTIYQKLNLMLQCTKAVNHLHLLRRPIIHGDIKPMNFLLNSHGEIKIGDFGLSRVRTESMSQSKVSQQYASCGGSIQYLAPELLVGFNRPTKQSDIYALTVVIWEILTCEIPYAGVSEVLIRLNVKDGERLTIPSDSNLSNDLNSQLKSLIEQGWHQQPQLRPTAPQLIHAIKKLIQAVNVVQPPSVAVAVIPVPAPTSPSTAATSDETGSLVQQATAAHSSMKTTTTQLRPLHPSPKTPESAATSAARLQSELMMQKQMHLDLQRSIADLKLALQTPSYTFLSNSINKG